jgi:hypothetical protein
MQRRMPAAVSNPLSDEVCCAPIVTTTWRSLLVLLLLLAGCVGPAGSAGGRRPAASALRFHVRFGPSHSAQPLDGRVLLMLSRDASAEPRFQIGDGLNSQQVFGVDVEGLKPGQAAVVDAKVLGYPLESLNEIAPGTYTVQALLHRYETFRRADGHVVKLPMDRGEGQQWNRAPGNLYSTPRKLALDVRTSGVVEIALDEVIAPIIDPPASKYVRHERIQSQRLTQFWGRPMHLGAHILLPEGWGEHPGARYPLAIFHGHFTPTFGGFREQPPEANLKCEYSERFQIDCYNRVQQEHAYQFYKEWTGPGFPRFLIIEIQHANPYYDDSYAVNSANLGPYGDAITYELIPYLERKYRALGAGWARFMYGGSTGGWAALAAQIFYPDEYNGCWVACPDPIDFRAFTVVDIYQDKNAYWREGPFLRTRRPGQRNWLGHVSLTLEAANRMELVLGTKSRSGQQWDIWEAVYSPVAPDGYPKPIWDKRTGIIDRDVAAYWRERYDLSHILRRDWHKGLGRKLRGKIHLYVGDMDNYYLNNAVYRVEEFLEGTKNPPYDGEVAYGDRAEHCWNGDPTRANAYSRLRYHQMHAPKIVERILKSAPPGADLKSWRY